MNSTALHSLVSALDAFQSELDALGFRMECEGSREAADVAVTSAARIRSLLEDCPATFSSPAVRTTTDGTSIG